MKTEPETPPTPTTPTQQQQQNLINDTQPKTLSINNNNERGENHNTDNIILAKDIETEKLLTAIELSKGFSDSYSTTRRARNRCVAFNPNSINSDRVRNRFR